MKTQYFPMMNAVVTACFVGTWIVLGIGGFFLFYLGRDVDFKRKWFPRYVVLGGILLVVFSTSLAILSSQSLKSSSMLLLVVPAICLISWLNIKMTRFCNGCGGTILSQNWFSPMNFCSRCGAALDSKPEPPHNVLD